MGCEAEVMVAAKRATFVAPRHRTLSNAAGEEEHSLTIEPSVTRSHYRDQIIQQTWIQIAEVTKTKMRMAMEEVEEEEEAAYHSLTSIQHNRASFRTSATTTVITPTGIDDRSGLLVGP